MRRFDVHPPNINRHAIRHQHCQTYPLLRRHIAITDTAFNDRD